MVNLVTGATGHIGNVLARQLAERGEQVRALLFRGEDSAPLAGLPVEIVEGDVLDMDSLKHALHGVERVFHLAGIISIMPGRDKKVHRVNVEGTRNVLGAALEAGVKRLVYTSSIHAIQRIQTGIIDERVPFDTFNAVSAYDHSKAEASLNVLASVARGLDAVVVCPTGVIGPYDYRLSEMGRLIWDCARARPALYVDGAYDFVDVRDVADGIIRAAQNGRTGETYIFSGERVTVRGLLDLVREASGRQFPRFRVPFGLARFAALFTPFFYRWTRTKPRITSYSLETLRSNSWISHAKAARELGYQPRSLRESVADTVAWFNQSTALAGV